MGDTSHLGPNAVEPSTHPVRTNIQETAGFFLQVAPYVQETATLHHIGLPKPYLSNVQHGITFPKPTTSSTSRHFADLCQQQTKLTRESSIKLVGLFFIVKRGREAQAPTQVTNMPHRMLSLCS